MLVRGQADYIPLALDQEAMIELAKCNQEPDGQDIAADDGEDE